MEVLKLFRQIYIGKNNISTQISLFSLIGILVILFVKYTASWLNLLYNGDFYISVPSSNSELWLYLFTGTVLVIYLTGFGVNLLKNTISGKTPCLPEITLLPFVHFIKALPYGLYLSICYGSIFAVGLFILSIFEVSGLDYIFASVMFCMLPFFMMLFIDFLKNMTYTKKSFNIFRVFKILELTIGEVIYLTLKMFIISAVPMFCIYKLLVCKIPANFFIPLPAFKLSVLVVGAYLSTIFNLVYLMGLASIQKDKFKS